ncbi:hypothetical protein CRE_06877 [Caenorhabditis remanei]|uniref:Uncharacterized protein n=1 Tax=Caenorhabditis remanei TaxID=31234 RepID=E3MZP2_CAERE|nr:hypothetical protein CRE_06877 [Caenorhabditis remanei]
MLGEPIEYESVDCSVSSGTSVLETKTHNGITCVWSGKWNNHQITFAWEFDWDELKSEGVDEITGYITIYSVNGYYTAKKIDVKIRGKKCRNFFVATIRYASPQTLCVLSHLQ